MSLPQALCTIVNIPPTALTVHENILLEAELFFSLYQQLIEFFQAPIQQFRRLIKNNLDKEKLMLQENLIKCLVQDIISSEHYSISGIATYTDSHEEVIENILNGTHSHPSLPLARKIFELHRHIRPELYKALLNRALAEAELDDKNEDN